MIIPGISGIRERISTLKTSIGEHLPTMPKFMQGNVGDTVIFQRASGLAEKGISKVAEGAAEGSLKASFATKATSFLGRMGTVSKSIPVVGVALSSLLELPAIYDGFKEGRGAAQIMKSGSAVSGTTVGSVVGATIGSFILPGAGTFVGGAIGAMAGNLAGNKLGSGLWGSNKGTTLVAAAPQVQQAPAQFGSMTAPNGAMASAAFDFNNPLAGLPQLG